MPPKKSRQFHKLEDNVLYRVTTQKKLAEILMSSPQDLKDVLAISVRYKNRWKPKQSDTAPWLKHAPNNGGF